MRVGNFSVLGKDDLSLVTTPYFILCSETVFKCQVSLHCGDQELARWPLSMELDIVNVVQVWYSLNFCFVSFSQDNKRWTGSIGNWFLTKICQYLSFFVNVYFQTILDILKQLAEPGRWRIQPRGAGVLKYASAPSHPPTHHRCHPSRGLHVRFNEKNLHWELHSLSFWTQLVWRQGMVIQERDRFHHSKEKELQKIDLLWADLPLLSQKHGYGVAD